MLLYSLLHLFGFNLSLDDLKNFRQWGSKTPGHPENHLTPGVEMATGPLGQGIATSVGMAIAETYLAAKFNRQGFPLFDHFTYVIASDGDLMEGISQEAASLAGHLQLGKLIVLYDDNNITIDGRASEAWSDDVGARFASMGWHIQKIDGMNPDAVDAAVTAAQAKTNQPSLIICRTIIGYGSPSKADTSGSHGSPLGAEEAKLTKANYGLPVDETFYVPDEVRKFFGDAARRGEAVREQWQQMLDRYEGEYPSEHNELVRLLNGEPTGDAEMPSFDKAMATRAANGSCINVASEMNSGLIGGCADLTDNVQTRIKSSSLYQADNRLGRNIAFGVREHGMAAAANGITLHGATRGFAGTFLIFSDYCRPSIRLAALMEIPTIFCFSHDSIGLGEDGPTHQPVEQVMSLRLIPNLNVMRPADANEVSAAWQIAMDSKKTPSVIVTSRQSIGIVTPSYSKDHPAHKGGYAARDCSGQPDVILVATGSEVELAFSVAEILSKEGKNCRVVSLMSWLIFDQQPESYRLGVLPKGVLTISIEAGRTTGWAQYAQHHIGLDRFGASAPGNVLFEKFGFTPEAIAEQAKSLLFSQG